MVYQSTRKSYLKTINTIHHEGLWITLGAYPTSPIESLHVEANEPPLQLRKEKLATQYYLKLSSCPNPTHDCVLTPNQKEKFNLNTNKIKTLGLRMEGIIQENNILSHQILKTNQSNIPPWIIKNRNIILSLNKLSKSKTHPTTYIEKFSQIK